MSYRDERTALQERVEVLEEDLRDARGKAEQVDALGREAADKQKEIDKLRAKLAKYEAPQQPSTRPAAIALVALLVLCAAGGAAAWVLARRPAAAPPSVAAEDELPEPCEAYFREIEACVQRNPNMSQLHDSAAQQRAGFKMGLSTPAAREAILNACTQSRKALQDACK